METAIDALRTLPDDAIKITEKGPGFFAVLRNKAPEPDKIPNYAI